MFWHATEQRMLESKGGKSIKGFMLRMEKKVPLIICLCETSEVVARLQVSAEKLLM